MASISVFFDLGDTLGMAVLDINRRIHRFVPFAFSAQVLEELSQRGLRLGVISNTGDESGARLNDLLQEAGLFRFFDPALLIYSKDLGKERIKNSPEVFLYAAKLVGSETRPEECLFVGEDASERGHALDAGWGVCPHPLLVSEVLAGEELCYVRIGVPDEKAHEPWRSALQKAPLVPLHVEGSGGLVVYALTSQRVVAQLMNAQFKLRLLGAVGAPLRTELYLLRDDQAKETGFLVSEGEAPKLFAQAITARTVLEAADGKILVALPPEVSLESIHFAHPRHGHTLRLMPNPHLLDPRVQAPAPTGFARATDRRRGAEEALISDDEARVWAGLTPEIMLDRVERFTGKKPMQAGGTDLIHSRHVAHRDNALAVTALAGELRDLAPDRFNVHLHQFSHGPRTIHNVVAELSGESPELVLISAHLDSIAMPNMHSIDPAPGADDDMSGVSGVLAVAECFLKLVGIGKPSRTAQFVLFNDEENGLVGSKAYARLLSDAGARIAGVFQMDMIGFNKAEPRAWEIHVGFSPSVETEAISGQLADLIKEVVPVVSPDLPGPQLYGLGSQDPAEQRSDHASFQEHGFPACCVSEDLFIAEGEQLEHSEPNPNYHKREDTFIDPVYAADIARAVGAAAWKLASS